MSKKRVYEIAKDLGVENKVVIDALKKHNVEVKSHMSTVEDSQVSMIKQSLAGGAKPVQSEVPKATQQAPQKKVHEYHRNDQGEKRGPKQDRNHRNDRNERGEKRDRPFNRDGKSNGQRDHRNDRNDRGDNRSNQRNGQSRDGRRPEGRNDQRQDNRNGGNRPNNGGRFERNNERNADRNNNRNNDRRNDGQRRDRRLEIPQVDPAMTAKPEGRDRQASREADRQKENRRYESEHRNENRNERRNKKDKKGKKGERTQSLVSSALQKNKNKVKQRNEQHIKQKEEERRKAEAAIATSIELSGPLTVKELAEKMGREVSEIIKKLMMLGVMATINQEIDVETAMVLAEDFGVEVVEVEPEQDPTEIIEIEDSPESLQPRPPVVTIMGHVDHGKTSLLDVIRSTNVTASEAGGITQHIGAYQVRYEGNKITFLDTPGHEAFTAMRLRGAQSTDIAVLVVAADDGVMPQTIEAINHAKSAEVPIIVAINKMDKPGANPDHVKQQLSEHGLLPEEWGGDTIMVPVSAKQRQGIEDLLETILLVAEVQELKANPNRKAQGIVIEAQLDKGRGPVCTVLVQKGSLRVGETILAGIAYGKVRAMTNERGEKVKVARPSMPVEILGLSDVPQAGEVMFAVDDNEARSIAEKRIEKQRITEMNAKTKVTLDDLFNQMQQGELKDLNIIIKGDVQGSVEALRQSLEGIKNPEVRINIIHSAVGAINESDVMLASASGAIIIGFNVRPDANVRKEAEKESVDLRTYRVIYDAINEIEAAMRGMLTPEFKEVILGRAEVRQVISTPKAIVAGSYVTEGKITNNSEIRLIRDGIVIHEGHIDSLRRFKDEVKEVATSFECGISLERYRDVKEGDVIEAYKMEEIAPEL
ncbi:translation initiation factor IF-2 [Veillonella sp. VA142]|uniref:translation initiation factor IF-2 n=1 Tax=Veillonella sp. VA142 TaxID=741834 RepID=UPI000F8D88C8|nr:translation initiation factor IF-2 [Veillonella sp. VA142]